MSATDAQIAQVKRMTGTIETTTWTNELVGTYIEKYSLLDERGEVPYTWDTSTSPPTEDENDDWIPTYDLNAAAADIWGERAATVADDFTFSADGGSYSLSDVIKHYQERERYYRSRRVKRSTKLHMSPALTVSQELVGNLNDPYA